MLSLICCSWISFVYKKCVNKPGFEKIKKNILINFSLYWKLQSASVT
jgi:hypothetical protein